ncbi:MAG: restriction endonuclease subunit M/S [Haliscomenobacteraceae bacterium CHB4]|nr:restriction endonuclease subunit M/S [Haliscomenobacteraceae bacterium CHB4]
MLDTDTKRRIDTARDILVGKVPDPKSQVEQITLALIYKFMDDMDLQSVEYGGLRSFFTGEWERYAWSRLFQPALGGAEMLNLYAEGLLKMAENPGLPPLFRNIFRNAYLPFRDPETLRIFLKTINEFSYDHSERLGDAYEYLLSVLGSQGDAGQFRTPRHIIDFIVQVVAPQKHETILDPACGTAGFLISAYKFILENNPALDAADRRRLVQNFTGYDVSPDMVRLSQVNMYLHQFPDPKIYEYDTLSDESRWNDTFDIVLANPPFMTPKGFKSLNKKFRIAANRSEVLFVDYIAEHIHPLSGRAAVIVPEGIIFQSAGAYRELRRMLVADEYLWAVASLPAGVFQPYSGVKTSVLFLDRATARKSDAIHFVKIGADGFDLGAQRRATGKNDLPAALAQLTRTREAILNGKPLSETAGVDFLTVEKTAFGEDYNLSMDRYRKSESGKAKWEMVRLGEVCELYQPQTISAKEFSDSGQFKVFGANGVIGFYDKYNHKDSEVLITCRGATCGTINFSEPKSWITGNAMVAKPKIDNLDKRFLFHLLKNIDLNSTISGSAQPQITRQSLSPFEIPLPPLSIQKEIVAQIERWQKVADGARQIVANYKPHIAFEEGWERVKLGEVCEVSSGGTPSRNEPEFWENGTIPWLRSESCKDAIISDSKEFISQKGFENSSAKMLKPKTTLIALVGATIGKTGFITFSSTTNQNVAGLFPKDESKLVPEFLFLACQNLYQKFMNLGDGNFKMANLSFVRDLEIPLPPLPIQQKIAADIEWERTMVASARELAEVMEAKIRDLIGRLWEKTA